MPNLNDSNVNIGSDPSTMPPEAPAAPVDNSTPEVVNNTAPLSTENKAEIAENPQNPENTLENSTPVQEPLQNQAEINQNQENPENVVSEPAQAQTEPTPTAQIPPNEPLAPEPEPIKAEPASTPKPQPAPTSVFTEPQQDKVFLARSLLIKARNTIQFRKRKKLDKIMSLFLKKQKITNDEVEKFLHISDATATRYLSQLEKENKIKQTRKTGHSVFYSKI